MGSGEVKASKTPSLIVHEWATVVRAGMMAKDHQKTQSQTFRPS